jgi:hypothetical protein
MTLRLNSSTSRSWSLLALPTVLVSSPRNRPPVLPHARARGSFITGSDFLMHGGLTRRSGMATSPRMRTVILMDEHCGVRGQVRR